MFLLFRKTIRAAIFWFLHYIFQEYLIITKAFIDFFELFNCSSSLLNLRTIKWRFIAGRLLMHSICNLSQLTMSFLSKVFLIFSILWFLLKNVHNLLEFKFLILLIFSIIPFRIRLYIPFGAPRLEMAYAILLRRIWWLLVALQVQMRTKFGLMKFEW